MAGCRPRHQGERHGWEWGCSPGHHDADDGDDGDDADDADDADNDNLLKASERGLGPV